MVLQISFPMAFLKQKLLEKLSHCRNCTPFLAKNEKVQKNQNEVGLVLHPLLVIVSWKMIVCNTQPPTRQLSSDVNNITQGGNRNSLHKHNIYTFVIGVCDRTKLAVDKTKECVSLRLGTSSYHEDITFILFQNLKCLFSWRRRSCWLGRWFVRLRCIWK